MIQLENINSLTDFTRNAKLHTRRLKKTGLPEVLTVNGKAEIVVQDAKSYQALLNLAAQADHMLKMRQSIQDMEDGRVYDFGVVAEELFKKHFPAKANKSKGRTS
jgi:hypothetical protein